MDVASEPAPNSVNPCRLSVANAKLTRRGPLAVVVVAYSVPVDSSTTRFRAPISSAAKDTELMTVFVAMSIAVIRPGVASVPRYAVVPTTSGSTSIGVVAGSATAVPSVMLDRSMGMIFTGVELVTARTSVPLGIKAVMSFRLEARVTLPCWFPEDASILINFAGMVLVPTMTDFAAVLKAKARMLFSSVAIVRVISRVPVDRSKVTIRFPLPARRTLKTAILVSGEYRDAIEPSSPLAIVEVEITPLVRFRDSRVPTEEGVVA